MEPREQAQSINQSINQSNQPTAPARNDDRKVIWWWYAWYTDTSRPPGVHGILDQVVSKREKDTENMVMINGLPTYSLPYRK